MPNYLISYLENTGSRSTRYVSMPHPNESSVLPKFLEKSDPEVARPASSTRPVQKTQPKAFEVCASIQINQRIMTVGSSNPQPYPTQGCLFGRDTLIGGFESTRIPQMPLVEIFCTGHVEKAGLATSGSLFSRNFGRIELSFGWGMDTYLVDREPVFSR